MISKFKITLIAAYTVIAAVSSILFYIWIAGDPEPIVKEVQVIKNVDRIVYRDYKTAECCDLLKKYDKSPMVIDYKVLSLNSKNTDVNLSWKLFERSGEQEISIPVHQEGNWKLYAGVGIGVAAASGIVFLLK